MILQGSIYDTAHTGSCMGDNCVQHELYHEPVVVWERVAVHERVTTMIFFFEGLYF